MSIPAVRSSVEIVVVGDRGVGKTSLTQRYLGTPGGHPSMGQVPMVRLEKRDLMILPGVGSTPALIAVRDIQADDRGPGGVSRACFVGVAGVLAVFDLSHRETFDSVLAWIEVVHRVEPGVPTLVVGNKCDLVEVLLVTDEEARERFKARGFPYFPTSATWGLNVKAAFRDLALEILQRQSGRPPPDAPLPLLKS